MRKLTRILTALIIGYILLAALYAVFTPKWQAPDEPAHFNYIRAIAETGGLPVLQSGDYDQDYLERIKAAKFPAAMPIDAIRYEAYQPPLYYLAATPVYLLARGAGLDATVLALRLFSVALGVGILLVAYRCVREIFPDDAFLALATIGAMATVPMHIAITASISNDAAAELVLALILLLALQRVKSSITNYQFTIYGGLLFGAALLTKSTAYVPGALLLIGAELGRVLGGKEAGEQGGILRNPKSEIRNLLALFLLSLAIFAPWLIRGVLTYGIADPLGIGRHDAIVIGQPTTAEMIARYGLNHIAFDYFAVTFKSFWAQFGWMGVLVNDRIYTLLFALTGAAVLGFALSAAKLFRRRDRLMPAQWASIALLALMLGATVADYLLYNLKFFQLQGRYLFPAMLPIALVGVIGLRELIAREYRRVVFVLLYAAMLALDLVSLFFFIIPQLRITNY